MGGEREREKEVMVIKTCLDIDEILSGDRIMAGTPIQALG